MEGVLCGFGIGNGGGSSSPSRNSADANITINGGTVTIRSVSWYAIHALSFTPGSDLLVTVRDPQGSAYELLMKLADSGDVFKTYKIYLLSGKKSTGYAMNLTLDLNIKYARMTSLWCIKKPIAPMNTSMTPPMQTAISPLVRSMSFRPSFR